MDDVWLEALATASPTPVRGALVAMPPRAANIYQWMVIVLSCMWVTGFVYIVTYVLRCRTTFLESVPIPNALTAALHGVSDLPVAVRFSKDQGSRWVTVCLFGMTVTALFNLSGVLLFGSVDLGGPGGLFYFYSYFIIFSILGAYFWPIFISHTLVHRHRGRMFGMVYSGLVLCTVFLTALYNEQSRAYALVLNAPYMLCGSLVFIYFAGAFAFYRPPPPPSNESQGKWKDRLRPLPLERHFFDFEQSYVRRLLTPLQKIEQLKAYEAKLLARRKKEDAEDTIAEKASENGSMSKGYGSVRRFFVGIGDWFGKLFSAIFDRMVFGYENAKCRFSTRLLTGLLMNLMIVYELSIFLDFQSVSLAQPYLGTELSDEAETLIIWTTVAATSLAFLIIALQALLTLRTYRIHMAQIRRGDYTFIPGGRAKLDYDLNDTAGFVGFQVGYGFVGFFFMFMLAELIMVLIWSIIYVESVRNFIWNELVKQLLFLPLLSVMIFIQVQKMVVRRVYLGKNVGNETGGTDGRFYTPFFNSFSHYEYFMTFVSTMRGFISYLYSRLLTPLGFMFLFSTRLDRCAVIQGWEFMDEGYRSYIGMVIADHHYNNPINLTFLLELSMYIDEKKMHGQEELQQQAAVGYQPYAAHPMFGAGALDPADRTPHTAPLLPIGSRAASDLALSSSPKSGQVSLEHEPSPHTPPVDEDKEPLLAESSAVYGEASASAPLLTGVVVQSASAGGTTPMALALDDDLVKPRAHPVDRRQRLRNLWWLAVTLHHNRALSAQRKHSLVKVIVT
eukprot:Unigene8467_Nuclearia_a/m.25923 Unigene8467_Nuclearia_a/g.25923  ORF Unigene8467_Nuclearia_a/g.25923 Unigene8467_Nuclearia_a/m.25923 type:complete len:787 (-) Unigene8467_Nuclearia_a:2427-4787(-)